MENTIEDLKFTWLKNGDMIDSVVERDFEEDIEVKIIKVEGGDMTIHFETETEARAWITKNEAPEINSLDELGCDLC